jgi:replicative DNA helicase
MTQILDAEQAVLGSLLLDPGALAAVGAVLDRRDFQAEVHRIIYGVMVDLHAQGQAVSSSAVADELDARGQLDGVGGRAYLLSIAVIPPAPEDVVVCAEFVHQLATLLRQHELTQPEEG